jgi:hypothetical protein
MGLARSSAYGAAMTNLLNSHWERVRLSLTSGNLRIGLAILSIVALALGGTAGSRWG